VIHALTAGGAERVLSILANAWAERGDNVAIATLDSGTQEPFFALDQAVERIPLAEDGNPGPWLRSLGALGRNLARVSAIRRAIRSARPDVVISFMNVTNVLSIVAARGTGTPVIATEHIDPSQDDIGLLWTTLRRWTYPHAGRLAVLNERVLEYFPPDIRRKSVVLPNPVLPPPPPRPGLSAEAAAGKRVVAMGRMSRQKGFDHLLEAFARVAPRHPDWSLEVWGEGPLREELIAHARRLGLDGAARFPGRTADAYAVLQSADLYVMSSRFEGFPMVLCEAMACGLPVLSFDCRTGPREIIRDEIDGILVPPEDVEALAAQMERLMSDSSLRERLASRAPEIADRFGLGRVLGLWDDVFDAAGVRG
jgi:glycosyltransferase involved in cell wall biosynthesis